jgi:uncharacterized protein YjiS (DUF1127 family)
MPMALSRRSSSLCRLRAWRASLAAILIHPARIIAAVGWELGARRAIAHLRSLDDEHLRDLGVKREDIERVVRRGQRR